jgi:hypothetical protein
MPFKKPLPVLNSHVPKPIVSAVQFANHTKEFGGATMDVRSYRVAQPGDHMTYVGGQNDTKGKSIPEEVIPHEALTMPKVLNKAKEIRRQMGPGRGSSLGSWAPDDNRGVVLDASKGYASEPLAMKDARRTNQEAVYSMTKGELKNKQYNPRKAKG